MHAGFYLLLFASASRLLIRHDMDPATLLPVSMALLLGLVYGVGVIFWDRMSHRAAQVWLVVVVLIWLVLLELATSFSFCAIPLFFVSLRVLNRTQAIVAAAVLTIAVIVVQVQVADRFDPSQVLVPLGVASMTVVIFWELRRAGMVQERERLSREIHDTLAQGLTSQRMLLQAAQRVWRTHPDKALEYVRQAEQAAGENLEEARRFVHDLGPAALRTQPLPEALRKLSDEFRVEREEYPLPEQVQRVLLRVAQGALANAREHAEASRVVVTLSYLEGEVTLDIVDDGVGFDRDAPGSGPGRGYGLRGMRDRLTEVGGTLVVESRPGEGTAVAARIPV